MEYRFLSTALVCFPVFMELCTLEVSAGVVWRTHLLDLEYLVEVEKNIV
jgi:hypothetical protein